MKYVVAENDLMTIADTIRVMTGTSSALTFPEGFVSGIESMETGMDEVKLISRDIEKLSMSGTGSIRSDAFEMCGALTEVSLSGYTGIGPRAFLCCSNLREFDGPNVTDVEARAFESCANLSSVSIPACKDIRGSAFRYCSGLESIYAPECTTVYAGAFMSCENLRTVSFPKCTRFWNYAFSSCTNMQSVYLTGSSVVSLGTNVFYVVAGTSDTESRPLVYVPSSMVSTYQAATNWSDIASHIVGI